MIAYKLVQVMDGKRYSLIGPDHNDYAVEYKAGEVTYPKIGGLFTYRNIPSAELIKHMTGVSNGWGQGFGYVIELYECEVGDEVECVNELRGLQMKRGVSSKVQTTNWIGMIWTQFVNLLPAPPSAYRVMDDKIVVSWVKPITLLGTYTYEEK